MATKTTKKEKDNEQKQMRNETEELLRDLDKEFGNGDLDVVHLGLDLAKFKKEMINVDHIDRKSLRFLIDTFYQIQDMRIARANQLRAINQDKDGDGFNASLFIMSSIESIEASIKKIIDIYTDKNPVCYWAKQTTGVGPLISATFYSMLDIRNASSAGSFLSYCGLNDNNTPWLGTEKAKKITSEVCESYKKKYLDDCIKVIDANVKKTEMKASIKDCIEKAFAEDNKYVEEGSAETPISELVLEDVIKGNRKLKTLLKDFGDVVASESLAVWYDPNFVTNGMIQELAIHDKVNRKPSSIRKGAAKHCIEKGSKTKRYITQPTMVKYLSMPPYSTRLKLCAYKLGDSILKNHTRGTHNVYGRLYYDRKAYENKKNLNGDYADQAARILSEKNFSGKDSVAKSFYEKGMLPPAHIEMRCRRYAVKMFISHLYEMWHLVEYGKPARVPYILAYPVIKEGEPVQHNDYIPPQVDYTSVLKLFNLPVPENVYPEGFNVMEFDWEEWERELQVKKAAKKAAK